MQDSNSAKPMSLKGKKKIKDKETKALPRSKWGEG